MALILKRILWLVMISCVTCLLSVIAEIIVASAYGASATHRGPVAFWALVPLITYLVSVAVGALWMGTRLAPGWLWGMLVAAIQPAILFVVDVCTGHQHVWGILQDIPTYSFGIYLVLVVLFILLLGSGALGGWLGEAFHRWRGPPTTSTTGKAK